MAVYSNLNKVRKLTNSSLTSVIDITNINFNNLSTAITSLLNAIQYDETLNTMSLASINLQSAVITSSLLVKQNGITKISIDNSGRIEGASMLFEVTETKRQRFIDYPDYPETGVNGEVISTGDDLLVWFDSSGWTSLTSGALGGDYVITISGNIVDNTDPNNPVIDQVQADWSQTDTEDASYIQNKPDPLWERGDGADSLQSVTGSAIQPLAIGEFSIATGNGSLAVDSTTHAEGDFTIAGTTLLKNLGEFEWITSNRIRISVNTVAAIGLDNVASTLAVNSTLGIYNNGTKQYEFYEIFDIIIGNDGSYNIVLDPSINLGISSNNYSNVLIIPNSGYAGYSHAEGTESIASGAGSHSEGSGRAIGDDSHAEGGSTAAGNRSHSEGNGIAIGEYSHAEGQAIAAGISSHSGGIDSIASGTADFGAFSISNRVIVSPGDLTDNYQTGSPFAWIQANGSDYDTGLPNVSTGERIIAKSYVSKGETSTDSITSGSTFTTRIFRTIYGGPASIYKIVPIRGGTLLAVCGNFYETGFDSGTFVQEVISPGFIILNADDGSIFQSFLNGVNSGSEEKVFDCLELPDQSLLICGDFEYFNSTNTSTNNHKLTWNTSQYVTDFGWNMIISLGGSSTNSDVRQLCLNPWNWVIAVGSFDSVDGTSVGNIVAFNIETQSVVTSFALHSDSAVNAVVCSGQNLLIGGQGSFIVGTDFALSSPTNAFGIIAVDAYSGVIFSALTAIDASVDQIVNYGNGKFLACGGFTTVTDINSTVYSIGGLIKFTENLQVDPDFAAAAGAGFNSNIRSATVQENGKILVAGAATAYDGTPCYNTVRLFEDGSFDTDLLAIDDSGPNGILELQNKELLVYGKIMEISGTLGYGGMALMPNNGIDQTTIILNGDLGQTIDGVSRIPVQLITEGVSQFAHGQNAVALQDGDIAIGSNVFANGKNSIATGVGSATYFQASSAFSSGYMVAHGDTQTLTFTQAYNGTIDLAGAKYYLGNHFDGTFVTEIDMHDPLKSDVLYRNWSIEYNAIVFIVDGGASDASSGSMQAITGHALASYSSATGIVTCTNQIAPTSSLGTLDTDVSGTSAISVGTTTGSNVSFVYGNLGLDGIGDGLMKIAVTFKITESCIF